MTRVLVLVLVLASCAGTYELATRTSGNAQLDDEGLRGGELQAAGGFGGVQLVLDAEVQRLVRDEPDAGIVRRNRGGGIDLGLRVSLPGVLAPHSEHRLERYFDFGFGGTVGGGFVKPARLETFGQAVVSGWIELGLPIGGRRYPVIVLEARRAAISGWNDATVFVVGIGLARRTPDFRWGY
ncbi:MAG TPA: hypothetical protein VFQ53_39070 [Kofleriaceae bacterium]|nr:hypothetical protein [Kofleriaceae bacterium]